MSSGSELTSISMLFDKISGARLESIRTVLSKGANVNAKNLKGDTLLHVVLNSGSYPKNKKIVKLLIESGADVNIKNSENKTPLSIAFKDSWIYPGSAGKIMKMLIEAGADVSTRSPAGLGALHAAASTGNLELVELLINRGLDANVKDDQNFTPLHYAAKGWAGPSVFKALLLAGAYVNAENNAGITPLHAMACCKFRRPYNEILKLLLKFGVDLYAYDHMGFSPLDSAVERNHTLLLEALVRYGKVDVNSKFTPCQYGETILHKVAIQNNAEAVKFLLENGANVNAVGMHNKTPLQCVVDEAMECDPDDDRFGLDNFELVVYYLLKYTPELNENPAVGLNILSRDFVKKNVGHRFIVNFEDYSYNEVERKDCRDYLWENLIQRLAKLHSMNNPIHPDHVKIISKDPVYQEYYDKCYQELAIAKRCRLHPDSNVTFYNLLMDDKKKLVNYAANPTLATRFKRKKVVEKFPIYGPFIKARSTKAIKIQKIKSQATKILSDLLPAVFVPEHIAVEKIIDFLNLRDLLRLSKVQIIPATDLQVKN